jgi:hypothetical protein
VRALVLLSILAVAIALPASPAAIKVPEHYDTLQGAIAAASPGDTVLVGPGTHSGPGNVDLDFGGKDIVLLAPAGPESTVIDCEFSARGLILVSGETRAAVVEGLTIKRGRGSPGAGIRCVGSSPTIRNVILLENWALGWDDRNGGGLACYEASPLLDGVSFLRNEADYGGGMSCWYSSPELTDVSFQDNRASGGGALYSYSSSVVFDGATFEGNEGSWTGGAYLLRSEADIRDARFEGNLSGWNGGGLSCRYGGPIVLTDVAFLENEADREGGGLALDGCLATLTGVTFARNRAGTYGGGATFSGGTVGDLTNVTVVANRAASRAGGICCRASHPSITLSVLCFNGSRDAILCMAGSEPVVSRCVVFGNEMGDGLCGTHSDNLFVDPLFCDMSANDFSLCGNSPCLPDDPGNPWGELVGAHGSGCGDCDSPVECLSWGMVKTLFRDSAPRPRDE